MLHTPVLRVFHLSAVLFLCFHSLAAQSQDLSSIGQLARDGAPGLAIRLLDQVQPGAKENINGWLFFERQRIDIIRAWKQWDDLLLRLDGLPDNVPHEFRHWIKIEAANARLQLGQGEQARTLLRSLLWQPPGTLSEDQFSLYRRLVIRSYLVDNNLEDAQRGMLRYQQDYGRKGPGWSKLQARVFLRSGRNKEAARLFAGIDQPDAEMRALSLLADLRSGQRDPESILGAARALAESEGVDAVDQARLWRVGGEASEQIPGRLSLTRALEHTALLAHTLPDNDVLFRINGDQLWQAYHRYATEEGNKLQLLIGNDADWLQEADRWIEKRPQRARAFYSMVMFDGALQEAREQAYKHFLGSILSMADGSGMRLLRTLFLDTSRFAVEATIPDQVRYLLVDDALSKNNIALATRLMSGLETAPEGSNPVEWGLRRARVLILGGRHNEGVTVLNSLMVDVAGMEKVIQDRLVQVVFDLQTVGRHEDAVQLFDVLMGQSIDQQLHRELLFWQADSYKALDKLPKAAWLYLRSATLLDAKGLDPWGQTARFRAAEVLADAGLKEDAQRLYELLMKVAPEPGRQAMLKYKLQELMLK